MADPIPASGIRINLTCEMCNERVPTMFCICTGVKIFLCDSCFIPHRKKNPKKFHQVAPSEEDLNLLAYQQRCVDFEAGKKKLLSNLDRIDQCCTDVTLAVDELVGKLHAYRDSVVRQLQEQKEALRAELHEAAAEAEEALTQESVEFQGLYASALRDFEEGNLELFRYTIDASMVESAIQGFLTTEYPKPKQRKSEQPARSDQPAPVQPSQVVGDLQVTQPPSMELPSIQPMIDALQVARPASVDLPPMQPAIRQLALSPLVDVTRDSIRLFSLESYSWQPAIKLSSPINFDEYSSYTLLDKQRILCCGGNGTCLADHRMKEAACTKQCSRYDSE